MDYLEQMFYEARPFIYGLIGLYAVAHYNNNVLLICGLVLIFCSAIVLKRRFEYRDQMTRIKTPSQNRKN